MRPLRDVTVVSLSQAIAGPLTTQFLGDLGAEVIKVEQPGTGDLTRNVPPDYGGLSANFSSLNRNKRSVTLDLSTSSGRAVLATLTGEADVVVQNLAPGRAETFDADFETLSDGNDRLIYCDISGYGEGSPHRGEKTFDVVLQAQSGLMSVTGTRDGDPIRIGPSISDISAATNAIPAILAALYHRERTGEGQYIDVALLDTSFQLLMYQVANYFATGQSPEPMGTRHWNTAPYGAYETSDGRIVVGIVTEEMWRDFCRAVDREEWTERHEFATADARVDNRDDLAAAVTDRLTDRTTEEWLDVFDDHGVIAGPIRSVGAVADSDHVAARNMVERLEHEELGEFRVVGNPVNFGTLDAGPRSPPPKLGEHTAEVLAEHGYGAADIETLEREGVI